MVKLNELQSKTKRQSKKRIGRGKGTGIGTYSGRGIKGQKSRSGGKGGLKLRGLKQTFKSVPKVKGFKSNRPQLPVVNVASLDKKYEANATVRLDDKKVLGNGEITKALTVYAASFSKSAVEKIEKAGGKAITCEKQ